MTTHTIQKVVLNYSLFIKVWFGISKHEFRWKSILNQDKQEEERPYYLPQLELLCFKIIISFQILFDANILLSMLGFLVWSWLPHTSDQLKTRLVMVDSSALDIEGCMKVPSSLDCTLRKLRDNKSQFPHDNTQLDIACLWCTVDTQIERIPFKPSIHEVVMYTTTIWHASSDNIIVWRSIQRWKLLILISWIHTYIVFHGSQVLLKSWITLILALFYCRPSSIFSI